MTRGDLRDHRTPARRPFARRAGAFLVASLAIVGLEGRADASGPFIVVLEPDPMLGLAFDHVPFDVQTAPKRIRIRNDGEATDHDLSYLSAISMVVVASGGGLGTGQEKFWDVACLPTAPDPSASSGAFVIDVCASSCSDDEWLQFIPLVCTPGVLDTPSVSLSLPAAYAYETTQLTLPFTNPGPSPVTITGFGSNTPAFSGALASGVLPITLESGQSMNVVATSQAGPDEYGYLDVLSGTTVINRVQLRALTLPQLAPSGWNLGVVPQGAIYTVPIALHNSSSSARTITAVSADSPDYAVPGLVGITLAPRETVHELLTFTATTLGARVDAVRVTFDTGEGGTARFWSQVVAPTFALTTDDLVTTDGRLDFGTRKAGSGPVDQTITITNLEATARPVQLCADPGPPFQLIGACPTTLPANGSVQLTVRLTPVDPGDVLSATVVSVAGLGEIVSALSAHIVASQLAFSTTELAFPEQLRGTTSQQRVTITNLAANAITVPLAVTGEAFAIADAPIVVPGGGTADAVVEFRPPAAGAFSGSLEIGAEGDPDHAIVALSGQGASPSVSVASTLDLGTVTVGATGEASVDVRNLDPIHSFEISQLVVDGADFAVIPPTDAVVAPSATLAIRVQFTPTVPGPAAGTLAIVLDDDPRPHAIVNLTGDGAPRPDDEPHGGCSAAGASAGWLLAILALRLRRPRPTNRRA